ncbi:hypothetical protein ACJJIK_09370 [Microbulbifer sp. ZKSA006]|uniref:hypothetical protein n=1 Tax=Microbulbifer sp. ZKSA006 TaxID=3243390 RepID=UPI004039CDF0
MEKDMTYIDALNEVLEIQGLNIVEIHNETVLLGESPDIDSLTAAMFLIKVEEISGIADFSKRLMSLPTKNIRLADVAELAERK